MLNVNGSIAARKYSYSVELFTQECAMDEYGKQSLAAPVSRGVYPAMVKELSASRRMYLFQSAVVRAYEMTLRAIDFIPSKVLFDGQMLSVFVASDVNLRGRETKITAYMA